MGSEIEETIESGGGGGGGGGGSQSQVANDEGGDDESWSFAWMDRLSPAARLFHAPRFNCYIVAMIGLKTRINPDVVKKGLGETLLRHPRFSSNMVGDVKRGGNMKWVKTTVNLNDHVIFPHLDATNMDLPDQFIEDYVSHMTQTSLDMSRPLWELHLLNITTSNAEAVAIFRIHHSLGDGASLMSLLLACTRKASDHKALPTVPTKKRAGSRNETGFWVFLLAIWSTLRLLLNSVVDLVLFCATLLFLKDAETPIKGKHKVEKTMKKFVHRTVSLQDIKLVKIALKMTINDVILGMIQAGLSRYLDRRYAKDHAKGRDNNQGKSNLPKHMRVRATILANIRPVMGIQELSDMLAKKSKGRWGNWIGYINLPFKISLEDDPLEYARKAKATIDRKKHSLEAVFTFVCAKLVLNIFGVSVAAAIAHRLLSNTTLSFSNVVGPLEEISFYGHPIAYLAPSVYGHPHALTIHFQSYVDKMTIVLAVDPNTIPDPYQLCDDLEEALRNMKDAVARKDLDIVAP